MRKRIILTLLVLGSLHFGQLKAQVSSTSDNIAIWPTTDRIVNFNISDTGLYKPITWGLDLAWLSEENVRRGVAFMGADRVDIVRSSFTPTDSLVNGDLKSSELATLNKRITIINKWLGPNTEVVLNCDHPSVSNWYIGNAAHWAQLIDVTARRHQEAGRKLVSVSPFNEPDYGWGQYTGQNGKSDFYNIATELRKNSRFDDIRICGGNTLNCDQALPWYNYLINVLDEGNTHQLAGSFDNYATFHQTVRANGDHATNDELHNVMEAMVGVEYGLQTGIWWGTAEYARGEFVKASDGRRLAYAEHRANWTAASVYRNPEGKVQAFGGTSERQAVATSYLFISKDKDVFFDGHGPQRVYAMYLPGGTGYQNGQTNAECVVNITWGDDIQPVIKGRYALVNRNSGMVAEVAGGATNAGANVRQATYAQKNFQQWNVTPVDSTIGGDFSYFTIAAAHSGKVIDVYNWSLDDGGNLDAWDNSKSSIQQWYLEYAGDGWFYIRSRYSAKCMEVANASTTNGANIQQSEKDGGTNQQWRFIPTNAKTEFVAPSAPSNLTAKARAESIRLDWPASPEDDVVSYTIFRSESTGGPYNTIARNVKTTAFVDNTPVMGTTYYYTIKAKDRSLNSSAYSNEVVATLKDGKALVVHLELDGNAKDSSENLNHCATNGTTNYVEGKIGSNALELNGSNTYLQLPLTIANKREITIATWVYWKGGANWQRIFDFGNNQNEFMYLAPRMRFSIKNGASEKQLEATALPTETWTHVAVTLGDSAIRIYINGVLDSETDKISIRPADFKPIMNFIGRGQGTAPLFNGYIDDFMIYNYELSADEVSEVYMNGGLKINEKELILDKNKTIQIWPNPANDFIQIGFTGNNSNVSELMVYNTQGHLVKSMKLIDVQNIRLNTADMVPGIYLIKLSNSEGSFSKKIIVNHH